MLLTAQKNKKQLEKWTKLNYDKNIISRNSLCRMSILRMPISGHAPATALLSPRFFSVQHPRLFRIISACCHGKRNKRNRAEQKTEQNIYNNIIKIYYILLLCSVCSAALFRFLGLKAVYDTWQVAWQQEKNWKSG
jgi:hypothetical protein